MALYDAFVSYSHAKDKPIAAALQSAVQKLGKPWYRRRALRLFRDDTSLSATPNLWPTIEQALGQSRFLILLASPEAAASPWVDKEVAYWLEHKSADTLLIAVTDGALAWDNAARRLRPARGHAVAARCSPAASRASRSGWTSPPIATAPIRATPGSSSLPPTSPPPSMACRRRTCSREEVRQQRRALKLVWSAAITLLVLAGAAGWQWWEAERAKQRRARGRADCDRAERGGADPARPGGAQFRHRQGRRRPRGVRHRAKPPPRAGHGGRVGPPHPRCRAGDDGPTGAHVAGRSQVAAQPRRHAGGVRHHLSRAPAT